MSKPARKARRTPRSRPPAASSSPDTAQILRARSLLGAGRWREAETLCRSVLERRADEPDASSLLGIILAQTRRTSEAADLLGRVAAHRPNDPAAHNNYGNALRDLGRTLSALDCYDRALALRPDYAEAYYNRGIAYYHLTRHAEAIEDFDRALALKPDHVAAWNSRGSALKHGGELERALQSYDRALALNPRHAGALVNRGASLQKLGRREEALQCYVAALQIDPHRPDLHNNYGITLHSLHRYSDALDAYDRALALQPDSAETYNNRGLTLQALRRQDQALESFDRAIALNPRYFEAHGNRGLTLKSLSRFEEALAAVDAALALEPHHGPTHFNRALILQDLQRHHESLTEYDLALSLGCADAQTYRFRGSVLEAMRSHEDAIASYERAIALAPDAEFLPGIRRHACSNIGQWAGYDEDVAAIAAAVNAGRSAATPFTMHSLCDEPAVLLRAAELFGRNECTPQAPLPAPSAYPRHEKIRIGYFSADFRNHAVSVLAAELFELHDRSRFELIGFSLGTDVRDELRDRVAAAFDRFLPVGEKSDAQIAELARELEIDIAVDLGGYTHSARPSIFALRAAPVQASYLGFLGTMGSGFMDYLLADPLLVPEDSRQYYAEKIAYLPSYQVNDSKRTRPTRTFTRAELGLPPNGTVYCCFNDSYKTTPETFSSWMRILHAVPDSVLFLLGGKPLLERNLRAEATARAIAPDRIVFGGRLPYGEYLARYRVADLFLDTHPYNAGTTASDALWAGLPVLTCPGRALQARMAASLVTAAGLPELVATDRDDYERIAAALAADPGRLAALKERLEANRDTCALFDTPAFARHLETLYVKMYERHRAGLAPAHLFTASEADEGAPRHAAPAEDAA